MKIIFIKIYLLAMIMASGYQHLANKKVLVVGKALNAMGGAVVVAANGQTYYLDRVEHWDRKFYGKKVKASGTLVIIHTPTKDEKGRPVQAIAEQWLLKKPKWELIK